MRVGRLAGGPFSWLEWTTRQPFRVKMNRMKAAIIAAVVLGGITITGLVIAPPLDNWLGYFAGRDLHALRGLSVEGSTIDELVRRNYSLQECRAYHLDGVFQTVVDCEVADRSGQRATLSWEVGHFYSPHPRIQRRRFFVCPLTREAAFLTPSLMPPGMRPSDYPDQRLYYSTAVYGIASMRWLDGDPNRINDHDAPGKH